MSSTARRSSAVLGLGAAACAACCAGPIFAFLAGLGLAGLASTLFIGTAGLLITGAALAGWSTVRERRRACSVPGDRPVAVASPTRR
jgi:Ca2+/Na+ antiporter